MTNPDTDAAIDRAVREMMDVDSGATTRARVLTALDGRERRLAPWMWAAAAATVAVVVVILAMRAPGHESLPSIATAPGQAVPHVLPTDHAVPVPADSDRAPASAPVVVRRAPERTVAGAVAPELPQTIPALAEIDPLVVPPPRAADIEPEEVVIPPLAAIPEIQFDPLPFPPGLRD